MPLFFIQLIFFGGGHEELGWRGILQPLRDKKYTYLQSNLIVGSIWGIWHLPLWFIVGESHQGFPLLLINSQQQKLLKKYQMVILLNL